MTECKTLAELEAHLEGGKGQSYDWSPPTAQLAAVNVDVVQAGLVRQKVPYPALLGTLRSLLAEAATKNIAQDRILPSALDALVQGVGDWSGIALVRLLATVQLCTGRLGQAESVARLRGESTAPVASSSVAPQQPAAGGGMGEVIALMHQQQRQSMKLLEAMVRKVGRRQGDSDSEGEAEEPQRAVGAEGVVRCPGEWRRFVDARSSHADELVRSLRDRLPRREGVARDGAELAVEAIALVLRGSPEESVLTKLEDALSYFAWLGEGGEAAARAHRQRLVLQDHIPPERRAAEAAARSAARQGPKNGGAGGGGGGGWRPGGAASKPTGSYGGGGGPPTTRRLFGRR